MHLKPGTYLHEHCYKIIELIGQGGFSITYRAEEVGWLKATGFGDQYVVNPQPAIVVIKELYFDDFCSRDELTGLIYVTNINKKTEFEKLVNKQLEEGRILKKLSHQNIVSTIDIFKENDTAYVVLDYVDGTNIEEIINKEGKITQAKALNYINRVLYAVAYIHANKILHLDITPSNILIRKTNDEPVLIDFGTAQTYSANNHIESTTSKLVVGLKKHYAPFEQLDIDNLKEFDATFDTYAIGATLFFMLTGTPPPVASQILAGKEMIIAPSTLNKTVNENLDIVILKALNLRYPDRYKSAQQMLISIDRAVSKTDEGVAALDTYVVKDKLSNRESREENDTTLISGLNQPFRNIPYKENTPPDSQIPPKKKFGYAFIAIGVSLLIVMFVVGERFYKMNQKNKANALFQLSKKDDANKFTYLQKASELGNDSAQDELGHYYDSKDRASRMGISIEEAAKKSFEYYLEAAKNGNADAKREAGICFEYGCCGLPKNDALAAKFYEEAAYGGDRFGKGYYGIFLYEGRGGLEKNKAKGRQLIEEAAIPYNSSVNYFYNYLMDTIYSEIQNEHRDSTVKK